MLWEQFNDTLLRESLWRLPLLITTKYYQQTLERGWVEADRGITPNIWHAVVFKVGVPRVPCDMRLASLFNSLPRLMVKKWQTCRQEWAELFDHLLHSRVGQGGLDEALSSYALLLPEEAGLVEDNSNKILS